MKRFCSLMFLLAVLLFSFCPIKSVYADSLSDSLVMQLVENHTENQINIDVKMVSNTGVSAMTLELVFDRNIFEFMGYQKGTALALLDLMSTDLSANNSLPIKFNWFSNEIKNDKSTGIILKLRFKLKENSKSGEYDIGFRYKGGDISYVENGNVFSKSAIISKAKISVNDKKISNAEIIETQNENNFSTLSICIIVVILIALVTISAILMIKRKNKKRSKDNWLKI